MRARDDILYFAHANIWTKPHLHKSTYCRNYLAKMLQCLVDFPPQPINALHAVSWAISSIVYSIPHRISIYAHINYLNTNSIMDAYLFWKLSHSRECNHKHWLHKLAINMNSKMCYVFVWEAYRKILFIYRMYMCTCYDHQIEYDGRK